MRTLTAILFVLLLILIGCASIDAKYREAWESGYRHGQNSMAEFCFDHQGQGGSLKIRAKVMDSLLQRDIAEHYEKDRKP